MRHFLVYNELSTKRSKKVQRLFRSFGNIEKECRQCF
jgi:hypothetical protein